MLHNPIPGRILLAKVIWLVLTLGIGLLLIFRGSDWWPVFLFLSLASLF